MPNRPATLPSSATIELLQRRVSVRQYANRPVDDEMVEAVLRAAFRAPTSSNIQAYSVIVVRDPDIRARLAAVAGDQAHIRQAPLFLAFIADLTRIERALQRHGHDLAGNNLEIGLVSSIDAALVGMAADLAADSLGLKGVMIGALRNDAVATARILVLPHRAYCVFGMCLGWPAEAPKQKPRMAYDSVVHYERYGAPRGGGVAKATLDDYDAALADHYRGIGKPTTADSWTHDMDRKFHPQLRDRLRQQLAELGFDFR